ncbi:WecE Predicted pyridoxal phosphate-dependent enzyme apparently involved in regulation of cell wall biogenesis [Candidatus Methylopumilus planktonicus]|uniref:DegT/DnrJ/EryC1/StrS family aminotransferase n=1 Tax=Candidatus Methylopumilus planktonicus TaxID=1581557 RepID=UPI003BEF49E4
MIYFNNFNRFPDELLAEELFAIEKVIKSGNYILGPEVNLFENDWAALCGAKYAVGVGNGMDAIQIGLMALKIRAGDEVILPSITAFATVLSVINAGATPVFADINPQTALMSIESVKRCISKKTKALIVVHLYGQIKNMQDWIKLTTKSNLKLIEDCAQSHLAMEKNKYCGTFGVYGAFSFYPTKNLGAIGDAGIVLCDDKNLYDDIKMLRNYGQSERYFHPHLGLNSRLDELQAAVLNVKLKTLKAYNNRRKEIAKLYFKKIKNKKISLLSEPLDDKTHVYHLFVILCEDRNEFQSYLTRENIQTLIHYPLPLHFQEPCKSIRTDPNGLPFSELHARKCLSIPCNPQMSDNEVLHVIDIINSY